MAKILSNVKCYSKRDTYTPKTFVNNTVIEYLNQTFSLNKTTRNLRPHNLGAKIIKCDLIVYLLA